MQTATIKEIKPVTPQGKAPFYEVHLEDNSMVTTFDKKINQASPGDTLEFEVKLNKGFINLEEGWKVTKKGNQSSDSPVMKTLFQQPDSQEDRVSRERLKCLECACLIRKSEDTVDDILTNAGKMHQWVRTGANNTAQPVSPANDIAWIIKKVEEHGVDKQEFLDYLNHTLHLPVEVTLEATLAQYKPKDIGHVVKVIQAVIKKKESPATPAPASE